MGRMEERRGKGRRRREGRRAKNGEGGKRMVREEMEGGRRWKEGGKRRERRWRERFEDPAGFALTRVVHVQFVHYPFVAATKHHDELLDGHGAVAVAGSGHRTRPAHHSLPAGLQKHRWRVGGRHGRSHSSKKGCGGKKSPGGKGTPQFLSHTPPFA